VRVFRRLSLRLRLRVLAFVLVVAGSSSLPARATEYSAYEREVIETELARGGWEIDPQPDGKLIAEIEFVRFDVFDERDPVPDFLNIFHVKSRERTIRRELLFRKGEPWLQRRADESARNMKGLPQLSLVLIVPLRHPLADRVRVLVITKDVWSLRLNSNIEFANGQINSLVLSPTEENLFGTHAKIAGLFSLSRSTYSLGASLSHERILGSRLSGLVSYSVVLNRESGEREGFMGNWSYGLPQYSVEQKWAFNTAFLVRDYVVREYDRGGGVARYDAEITPEDDAIRYEYAYERYVAENQILRSFGRRYKQDISFGLEADRTSYRMPALPEVDPRAVAEFAARELPRGETRISPFVQLASYETRFLKTHELETLGLTEDVRVGHSAVLRVYPASRQAGSSRDLLGVFSGLSYTVPLGDGIARGVVVSAIEAATREQSDGRVSASLRLASPRLGFGRLHADAILQNRYQNYLNRKYEIGGDDRLRGYPTDDPTLRGDDALASNLEFRTPGLNILSVECGAVAFYDAGGTADRLSELHLRHSAGAGLRFMAPEFDRVVLRLDWGFPLSPGYSTFPGAFFFTFEQAFPIPALSAPSVVRDAQ
jgi:hypothetical protein